MQEICSYSASEQKIYNSLNKDLVSKYFLVVFALLRLEQLLRFSRALQTSCVHPEFDIRTLSMEKFFKIDSYLILVFPTFFLFMFLSFRDRKIKMQVRVEMIRVREYTGWR